MSFEVLEQLESKIQTAVDTITLLQMEVEELKEDKVKLEAEANELRSQREDLEQKLSKLSKSTHSGRSAFVHYLAKWTKWNNFTSSSRIKNTRFGGCLCIWV